MIFYKIGCRAFLEYIEKILNPEDEPCTSKIEKVTSFFVGQGITKSQFPKIFKCQYLIEILRYGSNFYINFSNLRSHGAPL